MSELHVEGPTTIPVHTGVPFNVPLVQQVQGTPSSGVLGVQFTGPSSESGPWTYAGSGSGIVDHNIQPWTAQDTELSADGITVSQRVILRFCVWEDTADPGVDAPFLISEEVLHVNLISPAMEP